MERTCFNTDLSELDVGRQVTLIGWVSKKRNLGSIVFIDLRDRSGIIQITVNDAEHLPDIRNEYVISVSGVVALRSNPNLNLATGKIEIIASEVIVINTAKTTPMIIADETDALEDTRLKYRYLDLRQEKVLKNLKLRHDIVKTIRNYLDGQNFMEVETPILIKTTPEGARDYQERLPAVELMNNPDNYINVLKDSNFGTLYKFPSAEIQTILRWISDTMQGRASEVDELRIILLPSKDIKSILTSHVTAVCLKKLTPIFNNIKVNISKILPIYIGVNTREEFLLSVSNLFAEFD